MIHKGQKYKALREVKVDYNGDNTVVFTEGEYYTSPEDNHLSLDWLGVTIDVAITPDVADRCFQEDQVNHPLHYNTNRPLLIIDDTEIGGVKQYVGIECIDVVRNMPFWKGNAIKYLWRAGLKQEVGKSDVTKEIEDLEKAKWYIQDRINQLKQQHDGL